MVLLVTGVAGFIGTNFVYYYLNKYPDRKIVGIDKLTYAGDVENFMLLKPDQKSRFTFILGDITDKTFISSLFDKNDITGIAESKISKINSIMANFEQKYNVLEKNLTGIADDNMNKLREEMNSLKNNFVATISHELRTPLTAIRAYVETMLAAEAGSLPVEQQRRFLGVVLEESDRLSRLIDSVLDLSRFESGHPKIGRAAIELAEVVEEAAWLLRPMAEASEVNLKVVNELADTRVVRVVPDEHGELKVQLLHEPFHHAAEVVVLLLRLRCRRRLGPAATNE